MKRISFKNEIGNLSRFLTIHVFDWGVICEKADKTSSSKNVHFDFRKFNKCQTSPTISECIKRALSYFKMENATMVNKY